MPKRPRKKQEQKIDYEEYQRYKNIFELSPETILIIDRKGKVIDINGRVEDLMGYDPADLKGMSMFNLPFVTASAKVTIAKNFAKRILGRDLPPYEVLFRGKKGERIGQIVATPIRNKKGRITGEVVIVVDVTDRKRAEEKHQTMFELAPEGIVVFDLEAVITDVNQAALDMFGFSREEMIGKKFYDFTGAFSKEDLSRLKKMFPEIVAGRIPDEYELEMTTKQGKKILVAVRNGLLKAGGEPFAVQIIVRDVTEEKKAARALEEEREKAQKYLDLAGTMIMALDSRGKVMLVNETGAEMLGLSKEEIIGKDWFSNFIPAKKRPELKRIFSQAVRSKNRPITDFFPEGFKHAVKCKDGERQMRWYNEFIRDDGGRIKGTLSSAEDVTFSEAAMEEIEKRNAQLKRLNNVMIGREMRIIELKKKVKQLQEKLNNE